MITNKAELERLLATESGPRVRAELQELSEVQDQVQTNKQVDGWWVLMVNMKMDRCQF